MATNISFFFFCRWSGITHTCSVPVRCHLGPTLNLEQYFRPILQGLTSGSLDRTWMDQPLTGSSNPCRIVVCWNRTNWNNECSKPLKT
ncbi:hypothetical protein RIR_jg28712.t1 [Rhizophagus irregularis DAOM 181602=DAOM 197198]|nr:hypothetical protein RIR_jg28712.t1 [Rhizophagus irregularis DAOM 181602=DAOM 197198]